MEKLERKLKKLKEELLKETTGQVVTLITFPSSLDTYELNLKIRGIKPK